MIDINKMFDTQDEYDNIVFKNYSVPSIHQIESALLDELGELNHELKGHWCWWKKTQKPVERDKVLGELSDVLHFALCINLESGNDVHAKERFNSLMSYNTLYPVSKYDVENTNNCILRIINDVYTKNYPSLPYMVFKLATLCGFTIKQLENAYYNKNKVNRERVENGY